MRPELTVLEILRAKHGRTAALLLGEGGSVGEVEEVIPTGISVIDHWVLGIGGLPVGRASEVYGPEGVGKTSWLLRCLAQAQKQGGLAILAENECALQPEWARTAHSVDIDRLLLIEAETLEHTTAALLDAIHAVPPGVGPSIVAWDSIAATPTKREISEGLTGEQRVGERAKKLSEACRVLARALKKKRTHLMFVNQVRDTIGVMFGDAYTTPGGHAVKFFSSVRLHLLGGKAVKDERDVHIGKDITILAAKNKLHPPWRKARVRLDYARGWDEEWSTLWHAKELGAVQARSRGAGALREAYQKLGWAMPEAEL